MGEIYSVHLDWAGRGRRYHRRGMNPPTWLDELGRPHAKQPCPSCGRDSLETAEAGEARSSGGVGLRRERARRGSLKWAAHPLRAVVPGAAVAPGRGIVALGARSRLLYPPVEWRRILPGVIDALGSGTGRDKEPRCAVPSATPGYRGHLRSESRSLSVTASAADRM